jgi:Holliday junction resolvase RusA-like endonuclease
MDQSHALFVTDLAVVPKPRMTVRDRWAKRKCCVRYWEFSDKLKAAAAEKGFELGDAAHMEFHIAMPKSWSKKKKEEMLGQPHKSKPDLDNCIKSIGDILKPEDKTICEIVAKKFWSETPKIKLGNNAIEEW